MIYSILTASELRISKFSTYLSHMIRITFQSIQNSFTEITRLDEWIIDAFKNVIINDETFQVLCEQISNAHKKNKHMINNCWIIFNSSNLVRNFDTHCWCLLLIIKSLNTSLHFIIWLLYLNLLLSHKVKSFERIKTIQRYRSKPSYLNKFWWWSSEFPLDFVRCDHCSGEPNTSWELRSRVREGATKKGGTWKLFTWRSLKLLFILKRCKSIPLKFAPTI